MQLFRASLLSSQQYAPCVATIGNFDGLHKGHQTIIQKLVATARQKGLPSRVITFMPHPRKVLGRPYAKLMNFSQKLSVLRALGVDEVMVLRFNAHAAQTNASEFINYLVNVQQIKHLMVGEDFRFGQAQTGNIQNLLNATQSYFTVEIIKIITNHNNKISSSEIRLALETGDLTKVQQLLGRYYALEGKVVHGAKRGAGLGFPTANLPYYPTTGLLKGIYITLIHWQGKQYPSVTNVGCRPTLDGKKWYSESFLLNFKGNLYGERIRVEFIKKIRDEMRFENLLALKQQIETDVRHTQQFFALQNEFEKV